MWQEERRERIRAMVAALTRVTTDRIAAELGVSRETVRRDLLGLEAAGEIRRVHGGAVAVMEEAEPPFALRTTVCVREKRAIAKIAARLVKPGQTLFVDAGSTTALLADELAGLSGLTIVTNSIDVATKMNTEGAGQANDVILLGGRMRRGMPATFGAGTVAEILRYRADMALLSPVGIDAGYGATSFDHEEAEIARAMVTGARTVCILADATKWGVVSRVCYCPPERIDWLIGDESARDSAAAAALQKTVGALVAGRDDSLANPLPAGST